MIGTVPGWPQQRLSVASRKETYTLAWSDLPAELVADLDAYLDSLGGVDPTDPFGPGRPLKARSLSIRRYQVLQYLSALAHRGHEVGQFHALKDLCRIDLFRDAVLFFIERLRARRGPEAHTSAMIEGIAHAIRTIAKYWAGVDPPVVAEMSKLCAKLGRRPAGMTEKNRRRLAQVDDAETERRLLNHARDEMARLAAKSKVSRLDAVR